MKTEEKVHTITKEQVNLVVKMALFQQKIFMHVPPEIREKAFQEAIQSGELQLAEIPTDEEMQLILEQFGLYASPSVN